MTIIYLGLSATLLILLVFISIADYSLYSTKRNTICKGIDYAVCAAVQEIDKVESEDGLASGYDEDTGKTLINNIILNEPYSDNAFFSTLKWNTGITRDRIDNHVLIVTTSPRKSGLDYAMRKGQQHYEGSVNSPEQLEAVINNIIRQCWDGSDPLEDTQIIYVNGVRP